MRDPRYLATTLQQKEGQYLVARGLRGETFDMCLLFLEYFFRHEQWKGAVFHIDALYLAVEESLYFFPNVVRGRLENIALEHSATCF